MYDGLLFGDNDVCFANNADCSPGHKYKRAPFKLFARYTN